LRLKKTHLSSFHETFGHIQEFAGFEMPFWYSSITLEHLAVRNSVGIFDVTHMGRSLISGTDAAPFLDYVTTRTPSSLDILRGHYTTMCNDNGGIKDDLTVFRLDEDQFLLVYNASNRSTDYHWLKSHSQDYTVKIKDLSDQIPMFALQGPKSRLTLQKITSTDVSQIKRYHFSSIEVQDLKVMVTRSGYTGEDGYELYIWDVPLLKSTRAIKFWNELLISGEEFGIRPCGLGARDTLRLEAGMCFYGQDLDEKITPFEARINFVVKFNENDFIGRSALLKQRNEKIPQLRVGLRMIDRAIPRMGNTLWKEGQRIGTLTSGTISPLLRYGIGMGYVSPEYAKEDTVLEVKIRERFYKARVVQMPFYNPEKYGMKRKTI
jgi:aminomethyltransferase